jgi:PAS domain S-box-containing protein
MSQERAHVLHVEDNEATRYVTSRVLAGAGFVVTAAGAGDAGVALARSERPDLVLLDVKLPDRDGFSVCRLLKSDPATASIPIVFLSASHVSPEDQVIGLEGGADMYLTHPVEPHVLVAALHALLRVRRAEARYRRLAEANIVGVAEFDLDGRILDANDEYLRTIGATRADLAAGRVRWSALIPEESRATAERSVDEFRRSGASSAREITVQRADGARVPILFASAAVGATGRGFSVTVDLSERKRVEREREEALARAEGAQRRLAFLLSVSSALMGEPATIGEGLRRVAALCAGAVADWCVVDRVGPAGAERIAVAAADPEREPDAREVERHPPLGAGGAIARALATGVTQHLYEVADVAALEPPTRAAHRDALEALGVATATIHPLVAHGRVVGALTLVRSSPGAEMSPLDAALGEEVAARAAAALENARLHEELSRAVRAREDALAEVSHDLRNPLSAVLLGAFQLERAVDRVDLSELVQKRAATIRRAGERMNRLVHDLLDLARFEAGRLVLDVATHDVGGIVEASLENLRDAARERQLVVDIAVPPGLALRGDRERLERVLANLLSNAFRASPRGGRVQVVARATDEGVAVSVRDEGPGVAPDLRAHLFERYWRGRDAGEGGVGLGLSIVKALVESHGGRVSVESAPGEGATFTFVVPR